MPRSGGVTDSAEKIRDKLEALVGDERLDSSAIRGISGGDEQKVIPFAFAYRGLIAGLSNVAIYEQAGIVSEINIFEAGYIIGVSAQLGQTLTNGTLQVIPTINAGVFPDVDLDIQLDISDPDEKYANIARDADFAMSQDDKLGVKITSSGDFAPSETDLLVIVSFLVY